MLPSVVLSVLPNMCCALQKECDEERRLSCQQPPSKFFKDFHLLFEPRVKI